MGRIKSERNQVYGYKGTMPLKLDRITYIAFKMIFQIPVFVLLYIMVFSTFYFSDIIFAFVMSIIIIFIILFISDMVAWVLAFWANRTMIHKWGYLLNPKEKKQKLRQSIQYILYLFFRAFTFVFNIVWFLTRAFLSTCGGWSFLLAWIVLTIICRALSYFVTDYFILKY